jgi:hypothetical protein
MPLAKVKALFQRLTNRARTCCFRLGPPHLVRTAHGGAQAGEQGYRVSSLSFKAFL